MKRRAFSLGALAATVLTACGGGGSAGEGDPIAGVQSRRIKPRAEPAPAPVPTTEAAAAPAGGVSYPFGSRKVAYKAGIKPSKSTAELDAQLTKHYDAWKAARVVAANQVVAGGYAVQIPTSGMLTVSEGSGYGMLLAVIFAGHDPQAQALFDGLFKVVRARPAYAVTAYDPNGKYLMDWRLYADGTSAGEGWNAMDGDMDIAMALLMADKQWGSGGAVNYLQEARNTIAALKSWCMAADGTTKGQRLPDCSRTSDWMIGHFRAFKTATGDALWDKAVDRSYFLIDRMQTVYAPNTGLVPDFIAKTDTTAPIPSPDNYTERHPDEDAYLWNACRCPWRWASDYLLSGDARFKAVTMRLADFFAPKVATDGIYAIECGYNLDGTPIAAGDSAAFISPIMAGGCVDAKYQAMVDAAWAWGVGNMVTGYYDGEIQLLSGVVATGNWWTAGAVVANPASTDHALQLAPLASIAAGERHCALVVSKQDFAPTQAYKLKVDVCTSAQLRQNSAPDSREVAWVVWNYQDVDHLYYFALKPNGWEFGKRHPDHAGGHKVIATGTNFKAAIGQKYNIEVQVYGDWADVYINGSYCCYLQDNGYQGSPVLLGGKVGLYAQDAKAVFNNVTMPFADNFDTEPVQTLIEGVELANWRIESLGLGTGSIVGV